MLFSAAVVAVLCSSSSVFAAAHLRPHERRADASTMTAEEASSVFGGHLVTTAASPALPTGLVGIDVGQIMSSIGADPAALASASAAAASYIAAGGEGLSGLVGSATALVSVLPTGLIQSASGLLVDGAKTSTTASPKSTGGLAGVTVPSASAAPSSGALAGSASGRSASSSFALAAALGAAAFSYALL